MKTIHCAVATLVLLGSAFAAEHFTKHGTLVSIVLQGTSSVADNYPGAQPGRVPPGPVTYSYEITVQQGCIEYKGLYDSYKRDFAKEFKANEKVEVVASKRLLNVQAGGNSLRMSLASRRVIANCNSGE